MAVYIDKHDAYTLLKDLEAAYIYPPVKEAYGTAARRIDQMKAADVQPVERGRWIITDDVEHFIAICSECGRTEDSRDIKDMPYCHCGARMDGDSE